MRSLVPFAAVAVLLAAVHAADAENSRRDREDPELVIEDGGRTGACDDLRFTPDGKQLLAVGDDKVIRVWSFADGKIDPKSVRVLRWGVWREQRGAIYAMDLSPDGKCVAVGGVGAIGPTVALLDLGDGDTLDLARPPNDATGNIGAFWKAAFAPSGRRVAFGGGDGSVWLWDLRTHALHRLPDPAWTKGVNTVRLLHFLPNDDDHFLSLAEDGRLLRWTVGASAPEVVKNLKLGAKVFRAELSPDGRWLAAAADGPLVTLRSLVGDQFLDIHLKGFENFKPGLKDSDYARALAFDPTGRRLAVAVASPVSETRFNVDGDDRILFYDLGQDPAKPTPGPEHHYHADRLAFHPDGGFLAVAGGENQEVTLWDLAHTAEPASVLRGTGSCLWDVALSRDGQSFGFRDRRDPASTNPNARGLPPWRAFDPGHRQWLAEKDFTPAPRHDSLDGWSVEPDDTDPYLWWAVHTSGARVKVVIDGNLYGKPRCWTFLPPSDDGKPVRLAVGHYWGFSVFELNQQDKEAHRTRLCVGHQGEVTALGPSEDGKRMISCSSDMTLAAWDLTKEWPDLGAKFAPKDDGLVVQAVDAGSPAWEAGLSAGDTVVQFALGENWVEGGPAAWLKQLADPQPGVVHSFDVVRDGRNITAGGKQPLYTSVKQRPLWRFFPAGDGEWVLWMWRNNFYDSSTKGDYFVGWHVNAPDPKDSPAFFRVEQYRRFFRRPDVISKLLQSGDPAQALGLLGANPVPLHFDDMEPPAAALTLGPIRPGQDVEATLSAFARGDNPDEIPTEAELWINDYRLPLPQIDVQKWAKDGRTRTATVSIPFGALRAGGNVVSFLTWNRRGGRQDASKKIVCARPAPDAPRLIGMFVGVNNYKASKPAPGKGVLGNLQFAVDDAKGLSSALQGQKLYGAADLTVLLNDKEATHRAILDALDALAKKAKPDDLCILFLSGHGDYREKKTADGAPKSVFVFCPPDYDPTKPYDSGITNEELFDKMAAIPCQKLLILDACRSGGAVAGDSPARGFAPDGQGPIVMAGCDVNQSSLEHPLFGHGLFTKAILDALQDVKQYPDHKGVRELFVTDLFRDTRKEMPKLLGEIDEKGGAQVPILFAPGDEDFIVARDEAPK